MTSDSYREQNKRTMIPVYLTEGQERELQDIADELGIAGPGALLLQTATDIDVERVDTGVPFDGRRELPEPDYVGDMLLQSHYSDSHDRIEIRLSMLKDFYDSFEERAEELEVDPVNYMEDVVELAAGREGSIGWFTGAVINFAGTPGREL